MRLPGWLFYIFKKWYGTPPSVACFRGERRHMKAVLNWQLPQMPVGDGIGAIEIFDTYTPPTPAGATAATPIPSQIAKLGPDAVTYTTDDLAPGTHVFTGVLVDTFGTSSSPSDGFSVSVPLPTPPGLVGFSGTVDTAD